MCSSLISDPTEHFSKLIYVREIEKSFSIDLMSRVEIVILILKNCLVGHDIFKWHIFVS